METLAANEKSKWQNFDKLSSHTLSIFFNSVKIEYNSAKLSYRAFGLFMLFSIITSFYFSDSLLGPAGNYIQRVAWFIFAGTVVLIAGYVCSKTRQARKGSFISALDEKIRPFPYADFIVRLISSLLTYILFMGTFLYWKMKIPSMQPFSWDETFSRWDATLFNGMQAFDAFHWLHHPDVTRNLDLAYAFWGVVSVTFWVLVAVIPRVPSQVKHQYWLATIIAWIAGGLVLATIFSSAGPLFYSQLTGDNRLHSGLDAYIASFEGTLWTTNVRDMLWLVHNGHTGFYGGISAMPSMHNAQALMFVLAAFHMGRLYQFVAIPLAVLVFLGSIHLGWHYAIDSFAGYAVALSAWLLAGRLTRSPEAKAEHNQTSIA